MTVVLVVVVVVVVAEVVVVDFVVGKLVVFGSSFLSRKIGVMIADSKAPNTSIPSTDVT